MANWLLWGGYLLGILLSGRRIGWLMLSGMDVEEEDHLLIVMMSFMGFVTGMFWPVLLPCYLFYLFFKDRGSLAAKLFLSVPRDKKRELALKNLEQRIQQRERELEKLDRELGKVCG